jgi:PAS domain S-box-containing protein
MTTARKSKPAPQLSLIQSTNTSLYELLFHSANDAILLVDQDSGIITSANLRMQELTGFVGPELQNQSVQILIPAAGPEQSPRMQSPPLNREMLLRSGFYEDISIQKKDGYRAFASLSVRALSAKETGGQSLAFCILHDIAEKKSMERDLLTKHWDLKNAYSELERAHLELKSAQEALVQAGKLAALGELAAGVGHELNQPLSGIMGFSQELKSILREKFPDTIVLDYAEEIIKNSTRMKKIIQQLREFTRKSVEDYQESDVLGVINESLKLLDQQFKSRGISVNISSDNKLPKIFCNPFQLEQVFINLSTNARDAIEATRRGDGQIDISVSLLADKRFIEIIFKDNGCGMSSESKDKAFEPFFTTKEVGKGTGLGLSVSYGILGKINGSMMIESTPGKGTSFRLKLPVDFRTLNNTKGD